jgi:hypothetical protein
VTSSPLILSFDITPSGGQLERYWPIVSNREAIAVNQQWAGEWVHTWSWSCWSLIKCFIESAPLLYTHTHTHTHTHCHTHTHTHTPIRTHNPQPTHRVSRLSHSKMEPGARQCIITFVCVGVGVQLARGCCPGKTMECARHHRRCHHHNCTW